MLTPKTFVEDNPGGMDLTRRAFEKNCGANQPIVAEHGQEALDYLRSAGVYQGRDAPRLPAVMRLDIELPQVCGVRPDPRTRRLPVVPLRFRKERGPGAGFDLGVNTAIRRLLGVYGPVLNERLPAPMGGTA